MSMKTLLIADASDSFLSAVSQVCSEKYQVFCAKTGQEALQQLSAVHPELLVINLSLPYFDGLYVLHHTTYKPPVILALTTSYNPYAFFSAKEAGAGYVLLQPCEPKCVFKHLEELAQLAAKPASILDPQAVVGSYLLRLSMAPHRIGFTQLRVGIPLFAQDSSQVLKKELYTAIAAVCGNDNTDQVEHSIRQSIRQAWETGDQSIWKVLFPKHKKWPSNKEFIARMAQLLIQEMNAQK